MWTYSSSSGPGRFSAVTSWRTNSGDRVFGDFGADGLDDFLECFRNWRSWSSCLLAWLEFDDICEIIEG